MVFKQQILNARQSALYCGGLGNNINAIGILFDERLETAYLTFDATEANLYLLFAFYLHSAMIPLGGMMSITSTVFRPRHKTVQMDSFAVRAV